jgi:hypothetical protein
MNSQDRLIDAKISILQLAEKLESISEACKVAGIPAQASMKSRKHTSSSAGRNFRPAPSGDPVCQTSFRRRLRQRFWT